MTVQPEAESSTTTQTVLSKPAELLPAGWVAAPLSDVIQTVATTDPARRPDVEITYFDISSIHNESGVVVDPKVVRGADAPSRARQVVEFGDVLFSTVRPNLRAIAQVPHAENGVASTGFCVLRAAGAVEPKYLFYFVRSEGFLDVVLPLQRGVSYPAVRSVDVVSHSIPLAPAAEQTRIVEKLEELFSDLDAGVAELKAAQKKLTQYRQSLLKAAVEGALTAEWRKHNQPAESGAQLLERILKERRTRWQAKRLAKFKEQDKAPPKDWQDKYPEPVKPDISNLPPLPESWVWASAEQLCDFITKGTTPPKEFDGSGEKVIPFLRVTNLSDSGEMNMHDKVFVSKSTHDGFLARSAVYPGDVLMNIVGPPLGQVSVVPATFPEWNINQAIAIFRAVGGVRPSYVCLNLLSPLAQYWFKARAKTTAGQSNLTLETCRSLPIPLPSEAEQQALVEAADMAINAIAGQVRAIQHALKQSTAQRKNILKAAFSGQLVPQDPNDEPASVLLARIRAERITTVARRTDGKRRKIAA